MKNFSYIVADDATGLAAVVDPGFEPEKIIEIAQRKGLRIRYVISTHSHPDHASGNTEVAESAGARVVAHTSSPIQKDIAVSDGDAIELGALCLKVIHTPGHSPDGICLLADGKLLTGDTLFVGECGRTDIPGGSAEHLYESLLNKIMKLSDDLEVYPGHDYGGKPYSSLGYEKRHNYTLKPRSREEFIRFMAEP